MFKRIQTGCTMNYKNYPQYKVHRSNLGPVVAAHLGPGGMGLGFTGRSIRID